MKSISFKVTVGTLVNQVFLIPKNYKIKSNSMEELYEDIYSKYGNEDMQNLLVESVDPRRYQDDPYNLECTGFGNVIVFDPDISKPKRGWEIIKLKDFKNS